MDSVMELNIIIGASPDRLSRFVALTYGVLVYMYIFDFIYIPFVCITRMNTIKEDYCQNYISIDPVLYVYVFSPTEKCSSLMVSSLALHCGKDIYSVLYNIKPQNVWETGEFN